MPSAALLLPSMAYIPKVVPHIHTHPNIVNIKHQTFKNLSPHPFRL